MQNGIELAEISKLENTSRFLKSSHLRKVDKIENHMSMVSLTLKDVDLESEWRLEAIKTKRIMILLAAIFCLIQDIAWTMILQKTAMRGKIIRLSLDLICFVATYQIYYSSRAKSFEKVAVSSEKWKMIQFKINQQRESQRQFVWYQIFWVAYSLHQLSNDFAYAIIETDIPDYESVRLTQDYINHFFVGADLLALCLAIVLLDIHWILMGFQLFIYCSIQVGHVYVRYNAIWLDYLVLVVIVQPIIFISNRRSIKTTKSAFL